VPHSAEPNSPHWSADFVEHIRTVHFALVGVCLALIGLIQFKKPVEVTTAQYQLQEIKSAVDGWNTDQILQDALSSTGVSAFPPMVMPVAGKLGIIRSNFVESARRGVQTKGRFV